MIVTFSDSGKTCNGKVVKQWCGDLHIGQGIARGIGQTMGRLFEVKMADKGTPGVKRYGNLEQHAKNGARSALYGRQRPFEQGKNNNIGGLRVLRALTQTQEALELRREVERRLIVHIPARPGQNPIPARPCQRGISHG